MPLLDIQNLRKRLGKGDNAFALRVPAFTLDAGAVLYTFCGWLVAGVAALLPAWKATQHRCSATSFTVSLKRE
jgi:hypothetical protein